MPEKTELKLNISIDLMEMYHREGSGRFGSEISKLGIKFAPFTYRGSFETDEADLTEKKLLKDFLRAAKGMITQFSMGVDSDVEDVLKQSKVDTKNRKAVAAALDDADDKIKKDMRAEVAAVHKRMRGLMEAVVKDHSGKKEGVDFKNEVQVARFLKSLKSLPDLRRDYRAFQATLEAAARMADPGSQAGAIAKAYDMFISSDGVHLVDSARRIPKVEPATTASKAAKEERDKAASMNLMATALDGLRKEIVILADEIETLRGAYSRLQDLLAGHGESGPVGKNDGAAQKKQQAEIQKAFKEFPDISEARIRKVINSLEAAESGLLKFRKSAATG